MDAAADLQVLARIRAGESDAAHELHRRHHQRLVRLIELRLPPSLRRRVDPHDVVQEAWVEIVRRLPTFRDDEDMPLHVWMRLLTLQALAQAQRRHLGTDKRDARRDVPLRAQRPGVTSAGLVDAFVASATTPARAAQREELRIIVLAAVEELDEIDREIVLLRHFEELSNEETAAELGLEPAAASKRFLRALVKLRPALARLGRDENGEDA